MGPKVVILGAGYAGISAAHRLTRRGADAHVTVVNQRSDFVERIRLHQFLSGTYSTTTALTDLLDSSVDLRIGTAESIDATGQRVHLDDSTELDYDYLVYALGSHSRTDVIPGSRTHSVTLGTMQDAQNARLRIDKLSPSSMITVIGGGLTGIETTAELAEATDHRIRLISDRMLAPTVSTKGQRRLRSHLIDVGVDVIENNAVVRVEDRRVNLSDGQSIASDLTIDVAAIGVPDLARRSGLETDPRGALELDATLVSWSSTAIVGAGDAAVISRSPVRMSCQAAIPVGVHAAETVLHLAEGSEPAPLRQKFVGQCISLGRKNAVFQTTNSLDQPRARAVVTGRPASLIKEQLCSSTMRFGHLGPFSYSWS